MHGTPPPVVLVVRSFLRREEYLNFKAALLRVETGKRPSKRGQEENRQVEMVEKALGKGLP